MELIKLTNYDQIYYTFDILKKSFYSFQGDLEEYAFKLSQHAIVFALMEESLPIGVIAFYANDDISKKAFITSVLVSPERKGQGIGKRLMTEAEAFCKSKGFAGLRLEVNKKNTSAIGFYEKLGYSYLKDSSEYCVYMMKTL